ncbi:hypothetical protein, partial [Campylobacter sp. 2457A]|nr:hypothetical protein [Campylobacter sp. 2457A]
MENKQQVYSPYIALEFYSYQQEFTQMPIDRRDLGNMGTFINYSMIIAGAGSGELLNDYMRAQGISNTINEFYKYKLMGNFGIFSYLFKKAEGKDNERAIKEVVFETGVGMLATHKITKQLATRVATRFSITMAGRILGGYAGSLVPVAGTIVGAVVGGWIAGKIEEWWFSDEDQALAEAKAENERIRKLEEAYFLKINRIIN